VNKIYLGDGAYAETCYESRGVKLTTSDGVEDTNTIYLEPEAVELLYKWFKENR